jgi:hypothetical protein
MKSRIKAITMLGVAVLFFSSAPAQIGATDTRVDVKRLLSNGPQRPPVNTPQQGGAPPPNCLPGNCGSQSGSSGSN